MTEPAITLRTVEAALALPAFDTERAWRAMMMRPGIRRTAPPDGSARCAGVMVFVYPAGENGALSTLLIRRTPDPGIHSGQVGFPGGSCEPEDADLTATALREACEEVGVCEAVRVLGALTPVYIPPSAFLVTPTVGYVAARPAWVPNPDEVAGLLELPLLRLLDNAIKREEDWQIGGLDGMTFRVPFYDVDGAAVWGATALMLSELEGRLRAVLNA